MIRILKCLMPMEMMIIMMNMTIAMMIMMALNDDDFVDGEKREGTRKGKQGVCVCVGGGGSTARFKVNETGVS